MDDVNDYSPEEEEVEWRDPDLDTGIWAVADFFELLKYHFRQLNFYALLEDKVELVWGWQPNVERETIHGIVQRSYREHGWPDLKRFDKNKCAEYRRRALKEQIPDRF